MNLPNQAVKPSAAELQLMPGRRRRELEQRPLASGLEVGEIRRVLVPGDLEPPVLDAVVEPGAAEDELAQPVDERLAVHEREALPVPHEVAAQLAAGLFDQPVRRQLDEVLGLLLVELVVLDEPESEGRRGDALREVGRVEAEAKTEELHDNVVAGGVALRVHAQRLPSSYTEPVRAFQHLALLAPVIVIAVGALAGLAGLWTRVGRESLHRHEHPRAVAALIGGFVALIAILSALGLKLPRE